MCHQQPDGATGRAAQYSNQIAVVRRVSGMITCASRSEYPRRAMHEHRVHCACARPSARRCVDLDQLFAVETEPRPIRRAALAGERRAAKREDRKMQTVSPPSDFSRSMAEAGGRPGVWTAGVSPAKSARPSATPCAADNHALHAVYRGWRKSAGDAGGPWLTESGAALTVGIERLRELAAHLRLPSTE